MRINIIGGGLAGCAAAYILKNNGHEPVIYDAASHLASGASGNDVGLYNPRFAAQLDGPSQYYSSAFFSALDVFARFGDVIDWTPCGILALMNDDRKVVRFTKTAKSWGWAEEEMRVVDAAQASEVSGVEIPSPALYLPKSGSISPKKLCYEYARDIEVHLSHPVSDLAEFGGDATILACGIGSLNFAHAAALPLKSVRGQVSYFEQAAQTRALKSIISYSGYIAPAVDGVHCIGATFQPWLDHDDILPDDDQVNLDRLFEALPALRGEYKLVKHRAGVRTASRDHFPVTGQLADGVYISAAHGSHGILSSLQSAIILSNMISGCEDQNAQAVLDALSPHRFR